MGQYKVPQDVQREDKIFGPFTLRQFLTFLVGVMIGYLIFSLIKNISDSTGPAALAGIIVFCGIAAFAVVEIQGMSLPKYTVALILYLIKPSKRIWQKDITISDMAYLPRKEEEKSLPENPEDFKSRLDQLSHILDTKGWSGLEEKKEKEEIETAHRKVTETSLKKQETKPSAKEEAPEIKVKQTKKIVTDTEKSEQLPPAIRRKEIKTEEAPVKTSFPKTTEQLKIHTKKPAIKGKERLTEAAIKKGKEKEQKIVEEIKKVETKSRENLRERVAKETKEKGKQQREEIEELKKKVSSLEKITEKEEKEPKKITRRHVKKLFRTPVTEKEKQKNRDSYREAYTLSMKDRVTTPRFTEPNTNIQVDESELDDILKETEELKTLKKEASEISSAIEKSQGSKEKPKIIKGGNTFYG